MNHKDKRTHRFLHMFSHSNKLNLEVDVKSDPSCVRSGFKVRWKLMELKGLQGVGGGLHTYCLGKTFSSGVLHGDSSREDIHLFIHEK